LRLVVLLQPAAPGQGAGTASPEIRALSAW